MSQFAIADKDRPRYNAACLWRGIALAATEFISQGGNPDQIQGAPRHSLELRQRRRLLQDSFEPPTTLTPLDDFLVIVCEWELRKAIDRATLIAAFYKADEAIRDIMKPIEKAAGVASVPDGTKLIGIMTASSFYPEWDPFAHAHSAKDGGKVPSVAVDCAAIASALRQDGKAHGAVLVEYMATRQWADFDDIKEHVQGNVDNSDEAVRQLASKTSRRLRQLFPVLGDRNVFTTPAGRLFKDESAFNLLSSNESQIGHS